MSTPPNEPTQRPGPTPDPDTTASEPARDPEAPESEPAPDPKATEPQPTRGAAPQQPARDAGAAEPPAGQHAAPRPYPPSAPSSDRPPDPVTASRPERQQPPAGAATPPPGGPPPAAPAADERAEHRTDARRAQTEPPARDLPEPPSRPGAGRHLLAALLGLVLTPFALTLVGIGNGRLADIAGTSDMGTDLLGGTLLGLGVLMLAVIVLLGVWSVALPIVGGLVWGIGLGVAYLVVPTAMRDGAEAMTTDGSVPVEVEQLADAGMNGSLLVLGTLLVAAGLATSLARRRGRRWAEQVAVAERARADAERQDTRPVAR